MFNLPTRPGFSKFPRPMSNLYKEKMSAPNNAYYVLTIAHAGLPNSVLFNAVGDARYVQLTNFSALWDADFLAENTDGLSEGLANLYYTNARVGTYGDAAYLKLDGSNANSNINIGAYNFMTTGNIGTAVTGIGTIYIGGTTHTHTIDTFNFAEGTNQLDILTVGGTTTIASGSITDSTGAISFGNENLTTTGTINTGVATVDGLVLDLTQDYIFGSRGTSLYLQSRTDDTACRFEVYTKKGDGGDNVAVQVWGKGTPTSIANRERMMMRWNTGTSEYQIQIEESGTGTLRPLNIFTEGNDKQIYLAPDGGVHMATMKSGINQGAAGAAAGELYFDTNDDNTVKMGV